MKAYTPTVASANTSSPVRGMSNTAPLPAGPSMMKSIGVRNPATLHLPGAAASPTHSYGMGPISKVHGTAGIKNL